MTARALEKMTVVVTVAVLGVALAVGVRTAPATLLVLALVVTVSAGMDLVMRGEARYRPTLDLFILPTALVVGAVLFLPLLSNGAAIVAGLAIFGGLLFAVFWMEHGVRVGIVPRVAGETALTIVGYVAAFVLYAAIYQAKARSIISGPAMITITFLLALRQLRLALAAEPTAWGRTLASASAIALAVGEITWALNYWPLNGLLGGAFLLTAFYFMSGILAHHLQARLSWRVVAEFGTVAAAGVLLIALTSIAQRGG